MCSLDVIHLCTTQRHPVLYVRVFVSSQGWLSLWIISEDVNIHLLVCSCECYEMVDFVVFTNRNRREQPSSAVEDDFQSSTLQDLWYCNVHVDLRNCMFLISRNIYFLAEFVLNVQYFSRAQNFFFCRFFAHKLTGISTVFFTLCSLMRDLGRSSDGGKIIRKA